MLKNIARSQIQEAGVQYIIDSVVDELKDHPDRRLVIRSPSKDYAVNLIYLFIYLNISACQLSALQIYLRGNGLFYEVVARTDRNNQGSRSNVGERRTSRVHQWRMVHER